MSKTLHVYIWKLYHYKTRLITCVSVRTITVLQVHKTAEIGNKQCNTHRETCYGRRWKHWIETPIFKLIFNTFTFTSIIYILSSNKFNIWMRHYWIYNVLHRSVSYWKSLFGKIFLYSLHWNSTLNPMFSTTSATSCTVTLNVLTVTDKNSKRCIFPILPVNAPRS